MGQIDVFTQAQTFGSFDGIDTEHARGEYGWNYTNGDGVLFYPGTDHDYPDSSYGVSGPFASLRLKHWRRGIQDADYLALASAADAAATAAIVQRMAPTVLWEYGVENPDDPTYVYTDISWSTDPDDWETARGELADLIESVATKPKKPAPKIKANGSDGPVAIGGPSALTIQIGMDAGDHVGTDATWWFLQALPDGRVFYFDVRKGRMVEGILPIYQGALFNFPEISVLQQTGLTPGTHIYCFGIYVNAVASSLSGNWFYDFVAVNVNTP